MAINGTEETQKILVVGLGQSLRGDDGAGQEVVRHWQRRDSQASRDSRVRVLVEHLPGLALLPMLEGCSAALLVDAVVSGSPGCSLHFVPADSISSFQPASKSAHGWGIAETIALAGQLGQSLPTEFKILGIEAVQFEHGAGLSAEVVACLDQAADRIEAQLRDWLDASHEHTP